jgi:hypothetical protein
MENSLGISQQEFRDFYSPSHVTTSSVFDEPWVIKAPVLKDEIPNHNLCDCCSRIDFGFMLHNRVHSLRGPTLVLRDMIANKANCSFCHLAIEAMCIAESNIFPAIESNGIPIICQIESGDKTIGANVNFIRLCRKMLFQRQIIGEIIFIHELHAEPMPFEGRFVSACQADIALLRKWLSTCEHNHLDSSMKQPQQHGLVQGNMPPLRLVDVVEQCVVQTRWDTKYFVLSYVWGGTKQLQMTRSNQNDLAKKGSLMLEHNQRLLPQTIRDAIHLVHLLEHRYLWVDSLCIIQDASDKQEQILNMDQIYTQAALCIAAASGSDADAGLPRIRRKDEYRSMPQQCSATIRGMKLANSLPDLPNTVDQSVWSTRGWTYQERVLSKRILFIADRNVYFRCIHGGYFGEDMMHESQEVQGSRIDESNQQIRGLMPTVNFELYQHAVEQYSSRNLSFDTDAINAFVGVLSYLKPKFLSDFMSGLPLTEIDTALLWMPSSFNTRRKSVQGQALFPSWSWAGWSGGAMYCYRVEALSRILWRDVSNGELFSSEEYRGSDATSSCWIKLQEPSLYQSYHEENTPDLLFLHPTALDYQSRSRKFIQDGSDVLNFRTLSAKFQISGHLKHGPIGRCQTGLHKLCSMGVYNQTRVEVGVVNIPGPIACGLNFEPHEFLLLSRTRLLSDPSSEESLPSLLEEYATPAVGHPFLEPPEDDDQFDDGDHVEFNAAIFNVKKPWCLYNVMLVDTDDDGISHRVGLGRVHVDAFLQAEINWRDVRLG